MKLPGESNEYRKARDELLAAEIELRAHNERVAALRRKLPLGGKVDKDYVFTGRVDGDAEKLSLADLFEGEQDTLFVYNFMYGPEMAKACSHCTSVLQGLDAQMRYLNNRMSTAVIARRPLEDLEAYAKERSWQELRLFSSADTDFNPDYGAENSEGRQLPMAHIFVKRDGAVHHFWSSELFHAPWPEGMHARHVDSFWPVWNVLDLTPEGRGDGWGPVA